MIQLLIVLLLLLYAIINDLLIHKIRNKVLLFFSILGVLVNGADEGLNGFLNASLGALLPFILLFIIFSMKALGGGDIKLLSAIGCAMGYRFITDTMIYTFLIGGCVGCIILIKNGAMNGFARNIISHAKTSVLMLRIIKVEDLGRTPIHFSLLVAPGVLAAWLHPFVALIKGGAQ